MISCIILFSTFVNEERGETPEYKGVFFFVCFEKVVCTLVPSEQEDSVVVV